MFCVRIHYFIQTNCNMWLPTLMSRLQLYTFILLHIYKIFYSQMFHAANICKIILHSPLPTCVRVESPRSQDMLGEHMNEFWGSAWARGGGDKCGGHRLRQGWQLQGRRSSWAEYIYRLVFLRIRLLSNCAPVAQRHPHPPVVGDLCSEAATLCSHLRLLSVSNSVLTMACVFIRMKTNVQLYNHITLVCVVCLMWSWSHSYRFHSTL